jgi:hypothetical protein
METLEVTIDLRVGTYKSKQIPRHQWGGVVSEADHTYVIDYPNDDSSEFALLRLMETKVKRKTLVPQSIKLTPRANAPRLSKDGKLVAYADAGALLVREIRTVDPNVAEKSAQAAARSAALMQAKMVGTGLLIYASDADDILPNAEGFIAKLTPYLKDGKLLSNFTYTYAGGPIANIANPAATELGFVPGPGGRAIVYADGHAKWKSDNP